MRTRRAEKRSKDGASELTSTRPERAEKATNATGREGLPEDALEGSGNAIDGSRKRGYEDDPPG